MIERSARSVSALDVVIGKRLRLFREEARLPQERLASIVGVSCQQLQKYETGRNRVSAGRLMELAGALGRDVSDFYMHAADGVDGIRPAPTDAADDGFTAILRALGSIRSIERRSKILAFVEEQAREEALTNA